MSKVISLTLRALYEKFGLLGLWRQYRQHPEQCQECHADEFEEFLTDGLCDNCFELTNQQG